jgi:hypothetical protein
VQALQLRARIDTEHLRQVLAQPRVAGERLGVTAAPVVREHQQTRQSFAARVQREQVLQLLGGRRVSAQPQLRVAPVLQRAQPRLVQPRDLGGAPAAQLGALHRLAPPQPQPVAQRGRPAGEVTLRDQAAGRPDLTVEPVRVDGVRVDGQAVFMASKPMRARCRELASMAAPAAPTA